MPDWSERRTTPHLKWYLLVQMREYLPSEPPLVSLPSTRLLYNPGETRITDYYSLFKGAQYYSGEQASSLTLAVYETGLPIEVPGCSRDLGGWNEWGWVGCPNNIHNFPPSYPLPRFAPLMFPPRLPCGRTALPSYTIPAELQGRC